MTVIEHLDELRYRIVVSLFAIVLGAIIAYVFYIPLLDLLKHPIDAQGRIGGKPISLYNPGIVGPFMLRVKVSFFGGAILALPVLLYQLWRFITPGLRANERRYAIPFVLSSVGLFALGTWFAFLILQPGIRFLFSFVAPGEPFITFPQYISFVMLMVLAFGATFEFPLVLIFLAAVGGLTSQRLRSIRGPAIVAITIVAAVATPSQDPFSMLAMAVPLYVLYEASILVIRFVMKK